MQRTGDTGVAATPRRRLRWAGAAALASAVLACNDAPGGEVRLATWWGQRGEFAEPFATLKQSLRDSSGLGVRIVGETTSKQYHMQWVDQQLDPQTESPAALDVVAYNNGGDVLRWTPCAHSLYHPSEARLRAVDDPALGPLHLDSSWIKDSFDEAVLNTVECEGHYYALPVGLHRINTLFYNKRLLRAAGYDVDQDGGGEYPLPSSLDELEAAADRIEAQLLARDGEDTPAAVFALPKGDSWTLSLFFIENVMLASAGPDPYRGYWSGAVCDDSLFARALQRVRALEPYFSRSNFSEKDALQEVTVGNAALVVTGDWAVAETDPDEVGHIEFPGTGGLFVFTADVFALPDLPTSDAENGLAWLRAVTGLDTQREFAQRKHAFSARADDPEREDRGIWVPSLPAYLPGTELGAPKGHQEAFQSLSGALLSWLESSDDEAGAAEADAALVAYAARECRNLSPSAPPLEPGHEIR